MEFVGLLGLLVAILVLCAIAGAVSLVFWVLFLPFRLLGLVFRGIAMVLFLPILLLVGGGIALAVGIPLLFALALPLLPIVLLVLLAVAVAKAGVRWAAH